MKRRRFYLAPDSKFYRLTVLEEFKHPKTGEAHLKFRCDCGKICHPRLLKVIYGAIKSCGCLRAYNSGQRLRRHGHCANGTRTPTWRSWISMIKRCTDKTNVSYARYGGAGIKICERWIFFEHFLKDMGNRPEGKTLDRFPNKSGNYEKSNCRWADKHAQSTNKRSNVFLTYQGVTLCISDWENKFNFGKGTLRHRLRAGWDLERAFTEPVRPMRKHRT